MVIFRGVGGDKNLKKNIYVVILIEEYRYLYIFFFNLYVKYLV